MVVKQPDMSEAYRYLQSFSMNIHLQLQSTYIILHLSFLPSCASPNISLDNKKIIEYMYVIHFVIV